MVKKKKPSPSQDFLEKKEVTELQDQKDKDRHERKMIELKFLRETNRLFHERELERGRIKSAEIRRSQERKRAMLEKGS